MNYKKKYLKYKIKYYQLKKKIGGFDDENDPELTDAIIESLKTTSRPQTNFRTMINSGVPTNFSNNPNNYSNQCLLISIMQYFKHVRNQDYFIFNGTQYSLTIENIRGVLELDDKTRHDQITVGPGAIIEEALLELANQNNLILDFYYLNKNDISDLPLHTIGRGYNRFHIPIIYNGRNHFELITNSRTANIELTIIGGETHNFERNIKLAFPNVKVDNEILEVQIFQLTDLIDILKLDINNNLLSLRNYENISYENIENLSQEDKQKIKLNDDERKNILLTDLQLKWDLLQEHEDNLNNLLYSIN